MFDSKAVVGVQHNSYQPIDDALKPHCAKEKGLSLISAISQPSQEYTMVSTYALVIVICLRSDWTPLMSCHL